MNLTDTETLKFLKGTPVLLDDICAIYPAKLSEIVELGYDNFQKYLAFITMTKPEINKKTDPEMYQIVHDLTDFQYVLLLVTCDFQALDVLKKAFRFFCHDDAIFSLEPAQIIIGPIEEQHILTEDKFYELQRILRKMYFLTIEEEDIIINASDSPRVKQMKMQMRANREKVRRAKEKEQDAKSDMKLSDLIGSLTINDCGLNMLNVWDMTYYAFHDQLKRMGWRDQFNINQRAALAGAKLDKAQLKHWMRAITNSDK